MTWIKPGKILTFSRSDDRVDLSKPWCRTWSAMKIQLTTILRAHPLWIPKVCLMRWTMIYLRMTDSLLCKCQTLKNSCAEQCVDLGVHTIEMQLTPWRNSRERIRNRCSFCCALECTCWKAKKPSWLIVQICDRLEQYHDTKWVPSEPWRNAPFLFICHRIEGISFRCTWGRGHVDYVFCYTVNRPCLDCRLLAFRLEGPHFLFAHLVNGCESLARVSEKARDGPWKSHWFTSCVVRGRNNILMVLWHVRSCKEMCGKILRSCEWYNWAITQSRNAMHWWPSIQRRIQICGRIVKSMLSNRHEMSIFGTHW